MPASCRRRLLAAVRTKLAAIPGMADKVDRQRRRPLDTDEVPRLVVYDGGQRRTDVWTGETGYRLRVRIEAFAAGADNDAASDAAADLMALAVQALFADRSLGDLARDLDIDDEAEEAGASLLCADAIEVESTTVEIDYATKEGDPFTFN